jgi:hypothetical protein
VQSLFSGTGWPFAADSVIGKVLHVGSDYRWFNDEGHPTRDLVMDGTRTLLLLLFIAIGFLVRYAWKRKEGLR